MRPAARRPEDGICQLGRHGLVDHRGHLEMPLPVAALSLNKYVEVLSDRLSGGTAALLRFVCRKRPPWQHTSHR